MAAGCAHGSAATTDVLVLGGGVWLRGSAAGRPRHRRKQQQHRQGLPLVLMALSPSSGGGSRRRRRRTEVVAQASSVAASKAAQQKLAAKQQSQSQSQSRPSSPNEADTNSRVRRLEILVQIRRLFRNIIRADQLLQNVPFSNANGQSAVSEDDIDEVRKHAEDMLALSTSLGRDLRQLESTGALEQAYENDVEAVNVVSHKATDTTEKLRLKSDALLSVLPPRTTEGDEAAEPAFKSVDDLMQQLRQLDMYTARQKLQGFAGTLRQVWARLNGNKGIDTEGVSTLPLPRPPSQKAIRELKESELLIEAEELEHSLNSASKAREARLRQRGTLARTRLASDIREMDDQVSELRRKLAVRTLQLEMERIYGFLESDLLDVTGGDAVRTDEEETVLVVVEFGILERRVDTLSAIVERGEAYLVDDDVLAALASDVPDLKNRLGIMDESTAVDFQTRTAMSIRESVQKVREGVNFYSRGLKLMSSDINYSTRLFWQAVTGTTLKPREVGALRRTVRDMLTLVPFSIILITPMTPVGHVLVFSFLQRYFPGFFPSQFTNKRQLLMLRYEAIRERLSPQMGKGEFSEADSAATVAAISALVGEDVNISQLLEYGSSAITFELSDDADGVLEQAPPNGEAALETTTTTATTSARVPTPAVAIDEELDVDDSAELRSEDMVVAKAAERSPTPGRRSASPGYQSGAEDTSKRHEDTVVAKALERES
eukprot:jgi/Chlat1/5001/Chrsp32S04977